MRTIGSPRTSSTVWLRRGLYPRICVAAHLSQTARGSHPRSTRGEGGNSCTSDGPAGSGVNPEPRKVTTASAARETEFKERRATPREPASADYSHQAFGAYRIDQEVGKLVLGKAHRMDVLASRVPEDRRAIEASLIKCLASADGDNDGLERARRALEDYGFVARQSALLLQGRDAWERSSAARVLGQIGSVASLPALIEALHDGDSIVRNQAVTSLGNLKQPAAIGALLDVGRRYSDIPPSVLSESLSACSVEGLGFLDSVPFDLNEPIDSSESTAGFEPLTALEQLPTGDEDAALLGMLTRLESSDSAERAQVARELGMHRAERSVSALCAAASHDADTAVRSAAVTALGVIDHESVFAPVLIALADDTREVRAAAARALSGFTLRSSSGLRSASKELPIPKHFTTSRKHASKQASLRRPPIVWRVTIGVRRMKRSHYSPC
jgi:hypothetical protein